MIGFSRAGERQLVSATNYKFLVVKLNYRLKITLIFSQILSIAGSERGKSPRRNQQ